MPCSWHISFFQWLDLWSASWHLSILQWLDIEQFFTRNFIEKNGFEIFAPSFCLPAKTFITCSKIRFQLIGRELVYFVLKGCVWEKTYRSSCPYVFCKKGVLKNFTKFQSLFFNKVAGLRLATLLKRKPWRRCFPVNFWNF